MSNLNYLISLIPLFYVCLTMFFLVQTNYSMRLKHNENVFRLHTLLIFVFIFYIMYSQSIVSLFTGTEIQTKVNPLDILAFYSYDHMLSDKKIYICLLAIAVLLFLLNNISANYGDKVKVTRPIYIKYYIAIYLIVLIFYYIHSTNYVASNMNLLTLIITIETFSLLTIYIVSSKNLNTVNNLIIYFIFSFFTYVIFVFGITLLINYMGNDNIDVLKLLISHIRTTTDSPNTRLLNILTVCFITIFGLKLYVFPFSHLIVDLYNSIKLNEIIIISFLIVPIMYIIISNFMVRTEFIWNSESQQASYIIMSVTAVITFVFAMINIMEQRNLKTLIAYSSMTTSSFFLLLVSFNAVRLDIWWDSFFLYQFFYLILLMFIVSTINYFSHEEIEDWSFDNISKHLNGLDIRYIKILLFIIACLMVLPPILFIKIELIIHLLYVHFCFDFHTYIITTLYVCILLFSLSNYIIYIRLYRLFKAHIEYKKKNGNKTQK